MGQDLYTDDFINQDPGWTSTVSRNINWPGAGQQPAMRALFNGTYTPEFRSNQSATSSGFAHLLRNGSNQLLESKLSFTVTHSYSLVGSTPDTFGVVLFSDNTGQNSIRIEIVAGMGYYDQVRLQRIQNGTPTLENVSRLPFGFEEAQGSQPMGVALYTMDAGRRIVLLLNQDDVFAAHTFPVLNNVPQDRFFGLYSEFTAPDTNMSTDRRFIYEDFSWSDHGLF